MKLGLSKYMIPHKTIPRFSAAPYVLSKWVCDQVVLTAELQVSHMPGEFGDSDKAVAYRQYRNDMDCARSKASSLLGRLADDSFQAKNESIAIEAKSKE